MRYKYTESEINEILKRLVILIDSREQENSHVVNWLNKSKKSYKVQKLDYGDYSCMLPVGSFKGQTRDIYFTDTIAIERKFCIDEIAMNLKDKKTNVNEVNKEIIELLGQKYLEKVLKTDYNRLKFELANMNRYDIEFYIFIEDKDFDKNIREHNYRSLYAPDVLRKRLWALEREFHTLIRPINKAYMGSEIYNTLRYSVRNVLVHKGFIDDDFSNLEEELKWKI